VHESANNGKFFFLSLPLYGRYSTSDSPLDPTKGYTFFYSAAPYQSLQKTNVRFVRQEFTANFYVPLVPNNRVMFALHAFFGSVAGAPWEDLPIPKLFLGGSEDDLRGYDYKTVSPLDSSGQPMGGRSAIFTTLELRFRITKNIGLVPFADFGTVSMKEWPEFTEKWYKSVGGGIRYFSFFGPIRLDVGFPLNPREGHDTWGKVYASIGQCF
jgi:translocation and assembly module TamA